MGLTTVPTIPTNISILTNIIIATADFERR
jgi:hypothetical protein